MRKHVWRSGLRNFIHLDKRLYNKVPKVFNRMQFVSVISVLVLSSSILFFFLFPKPLVELCDLSTCPFCYGNNLCNHFKENKIHLEFNTFSKLFYNMFSVKNVYFALYNEQHVILKKLASESELANLNMTKSNCSVNGILQFLNINKKSYGFCGNTSKTFLKSVFYDDLKHICTILHINIEPLILQIFNKNNSWPVPTLHGFCGRFVVIENAGDPLNTIEQYDWYERAFVAYQLLMAARNFTEDHQIFQLYLTDISPDNIVIDYNLKISFVDLGNVVMALKQTSQTNFSNSHYSENFEEENYMFSERQICEYEISDHNIFSVCKLLLSKNSPWPMTKGGLLHTPPASIIYNYERLFINIELCVFSPQRLNRFQLSNKILNDLKIILSLKKYFMQKS